MNQKITVVSKPVLSEQTRGTEDPYTLGANVFRDLPEVFTRLGIGYAVEKACRLAFFEALNFHDPASFEQSYEDFAVPYREAFLRGYREARDAAYRHTEQ